MKSTSIFLGICLIFSTAVSSQAANKPRLVIKPSIRKSKAPKFAVSSKSSLLRRVSKKNKVDIGKFKLVGPKPGHPAYKTDKGVTLSAGHLKHEGTGSWLSIRHAVWSHRNKKWLEQSPDTAPMELRIPQNTSVFPPAVAYACFNKVSTKKHVYILTVSSTIPQGKLGLFVLNDTVPTSSIMYSASLKQHYVMLEMAAKADQEVNVIVKADYKNPGVQDFFHHVQLIQLD